MKIKLLFTPKFYKDSPEHQQRSCLLPPIGIPILKSFLKKYNYRADIDDLNIKVIYDNKHSKSQSKKVDLEVFENVNRVKNFIKNKHDAVLEEEGGKILKKTNYAGYDMIGLSILEEKYFSAISIALVLSKLLKDATGAKIVIGGITYPRPTVEIQEFINSGFVDYVITGEGEIPLLNLCDVLENDYVNEVNIPRLYYKGCEKNLNRRPIKYGFDLHCFVRPDFDGLPLELYKYKPDDDSIKANLEVLMLPYIFVRGCPNKCIFCTQSLWPTHVSNDVSTVALDIKELSKKYRTKYFFFMNTTINPTYEYANQLADELIKNDVDIMWTDDANFKTMDVKLLRKLKKAGAVRLIFGLESASPKMQTYILKNVNINHAEKILKESHRLGIWNELDLIAGLPHETDEDIDCTINFIERNKQHLDFCYLNRFRLIESLLLQNPEKFGITNIRDIVHNIFNIGWFSRGFDEIGGLMWDEKVKQIVYSYDRVNDCIIKNVNNTGYDGNGKMHVLFYLYSIFKTKQEIIEYFKNRR